MTPEAALNILRICNATRPGWTRASDELVVLKGARAELCVFISKRNRRAWVRLPEGGTQVHGGESGPDNESWVRDMLTLLLTDFDAANRTTRTGLVVHA